MARARLHCFFVLLLYSQSNYGQQVSGNNQNNGINNINGMQQQTFQRPPKNFNQPQNGAVNVNMPQQFNSQQANLQLPAAMTGPNLGNMQQQLNPAPNLPCQSPPGNQNGFQITKIGFTPVGPGMAEAPCSAMQPIQNLPMNIGPQGVGQMVNSPLSMSTIAELASLKGQPSLLSLLNSQCNGQQQQSPQMMMNSQNQLTDAQKQFLVRSLQGQNQQGINVVQAQPTVLNMENQQPITVRAIPPQQSQAIVTPLGNQPAYITVQAQPLVTYLQNQAQAQPQPQVIVEEEPSLLSLILSELGPQYAVNSAYTPPKKGSKSNLKSLIPIIISMLKEKNNCGCRNCGCPNNCQSNVPSNNVELDPQIAQIFGGYSNQVNYSQDSDDVLARIKKNDKEETSNEKQEKVEDKKKAESVESEEVSDENSSEYIDDDDE